MDTTLDPSASGSQSERSEKYGSIGPEVTQGVSLLIGEPKKAIRQLSGPMILAMLIIAAYNLVNAVWVSGLGPDALAAVGFIAPIYVVALGLSNGLAAGITYSISRRIGASDKTGADNTAAHAMLLGAVLTVALTLPLYFFLEPIVKAMGVGSVAPLAVEYGRIIFAGTVFLVFQSIAYAVLRAEGDTRRAMYVMSAASILNAVLDPILIYHAGLGIAGAAWGTVISLAIGSLVLFYWMMIKRDTYVSISRKTFSFSRPIVADILQVGMPASMEFLLYSVEALVFNSLLAAVAGTDAVAVYTAGWRVVMFAVIPVDAMSIAALSVAAAAFGARHYGNLEVTLRYSMKLGCLIALATSALTWALAPHIAALFTYGPGSTSLGPNVVAFLRVMCLFYPFVSPGLMAASIFQGTGRGIFSFILNLLRVVVFAGVLAFILGIVLGLGEKGIWWGLVLGNIIGSSIGYLWARIFIDRLKAQDGLGPEYSKALDPL